MADHLDFSEFRRDRRPNNFLMAPDGVCRNSKPDMPSPVIPGTPQQVFARIEDLVGKEKLWKNLDARPGELSLRFVAVTPLLRFRDDVDVRVFPGPSADESQLAIYSRSRVGYSDLGKNASRVRDLVNRLIAK